MDVDFPREDPVGPHQAQAILDPRRAVGDPGEIVLASVLLPDLMEGAMIGRDGLDKPRREAGPQRLLMALGADRRAHHVRRALEAGLLVDRVVEEQVLRARLGEHDLAPAPRLGDGGEGLLAGEVHDVDRLARLVASPSSGEGRLSAW